MAIADTHSTPTPSRGLGRVGVVLSGALFAVGVVLALRPSSEIFGVDLAMLGAGAMLVGLFGLTLTILVWAARGPGAVQDTYGLQLDRRQRHRIGRT